MRWYFRTVDTLVQSYQTSITVQGHSCWIRVEWGLCFSSVLTAHSGAFEEQGNDRDQDKDHSFVSQTIFTNASILCRLQILIVL